VGQSHLPPQHGACALVAASASELGFVVPKLMYAASLSTRHSASLLTLTKGRCGPERTFALVLRAHGRPHPARAKRGNISAGLYRLLCVRHMLWRWRRAVDEPMLVSEMIDQAHSCWQPPKLAELLATVVACKHLYAYSSDQPLLTCAAVPCRLAATTLLRACSQSCVKVGPILRDEIRVSLQNAPPSCDRRPVLTRQPNC
jgi:hypothetical protein